jgi:hypothetical protein
MEIQTQTMTLRIDEIQMIINQIAIINFTKRMLKMEKGLTELLGLIKLGTKDSDTNSRESHDDTDLERGKGKLKKSKREKENERRVVKKKETGNGKKEVKMVKSDSNMATYIVCLGIWMKFRQN